MITYGMHALGEGAVGRVKDVCVCMYVCVRSRPALPLLPSPPPFPSSPPRLLPALTAMPPASATALMACMRPFMVSTSYMERMMEAACGTNWMYCTMPSGVVGA